jgi:uncharacterized protein
MQPHFKILTLAVDDLDRSLDFYRDGLGLPTEGIIGQEFEYGAVVFFDLKDGLKLAIWPAASLARDARLEPTRNRLGAVSIGHIVASRAEVDALAAQVEKAGGTVTDGPCERFWGGYSAHFHDPDGHLWEITWHPQWSASL